MFRRSERVKLGLVEQTSQSGTSGSEPIMRMTQDETRTVGRARNARKRCARGAASERGTVLLMVIGVLALLAVIAVAYVTIGRADRVTSTTIIRQTRIDDQSQAVTDYLTGVIRDDLFSVFPERLAADSTLDPRDLANARYRRAAWDYPDVDPRMRSDRSATVPADGDYRFNPAGTVTTPWFNESTRDPRRASNPWLASSAPMRYMDERVTGNDFPNAYNTADLGRYVDLFNISNFAPDGKFVNLVNLRGNFDAEPGIGTAADGRSRMSRELTLINPATGLPYASTAVSRRWDNRPIGSTPEYLSSPSTYSLMQLGASRPAVDNIAPGHPNHILNQWCDTDGDGFVDARWFELVDSFDPAIVTWLLPRDGRMRYFVAARAIDLSGLVNVNTATDFTYAPGYTPTAVYGAMTPAETAPAATSQRYFPAGLGVSDVDLRRLLMMNDQYFEFENAYNNAWQPTPANNPANYAQYTVERAAETGRAAYAAILASRDRGLRLGIEDAVGGNGNHAALFEENANRQTLIAGNPNPLDPVLRWRHYESFGLDPSGATDARDPLLRRQTPAGPREARQPFGLDSELELRAFNGINDSNSLSPLEQVTGGRAAVGNDPLARFDPLRSNRPIFAELQGRPDTSTGTGILPNDAARLLALTDIRRLLTTVNGARPLMNAPITALDEIGANELKTDFVAIRNAIAPLQVNGTTPPTVEPIAVTNTQQKRDAINALYLGYLEALAPYRDRDRYPRAWVPPTNFAPDQRNNSLSYGRTSVELASRMAAFMALNVADALDVDPREREHEPTIMVHTLDQNPPAAPANSALEDARNDTDVVQSVVPADFPDSAPATETRTKQMLLMGIEPQPFLVEAMYAMFYSDVPDAAFGSSNDSFDPTIPPGPGGPVPANPVNIDWSRDLNNGDYLGEVIAFQLTNPFDTPIFLTKADGSPLFYIENAGRFFPLTNLSDDGAVIGAQELKLEAGRTRTYFAMSPGSFSAIDERLRNAVMETGSGSFVPDFRSRVNSRFGTDCQFIPMGKRGSLTEHESDTLVNVMGQEMRFNDLIGASVTDPHDSETVKLWRVHRNAATPTESRGDILVDRLRQVPGSEKSDLAGLGKALDALGTEDINNSMSGQDPGSFTNPVPTRAVNGENIGFSAVAWRALRRPTDPTFGEQAKSFLPPWCIEAKRNNARNANTPYNIGDGLDAISGSAFEAEDFDNSDNSSQGFENLVGMLDEWGRTTDRLNSQISKEAKDKTGNDLLTNSSTIRDFPGTSNRAARYADMAPQMLSIGNEGNLMLFTRAGDLLLPLALGPCYDPTLEAAAGGNAALAEEYSRLTLSEVLAIASDYYSPDPTYAGTWVEYLTDIAHVNVGGSPAVKPILSRGCLVTDDFVPFFDANNNGQFDYDTDDQPLGNGVPLALNILSQFRTADFRLQTSYGTLNRAVPGVVNINTAPLPVLRTVPMLSPDPGDLTSTSTYPSEPWVRTPATNPAGGTVVLYNPTDTSRNDPFDIAAAVLSYRDKTDVATRPGNTSANRGRVEFAEEFGTLREPNAWEARRERTGMSALREESGFRSEGELGAVVIRTRRNLPDADELNSIDRLGRDGLPVVAPGLVTELAKTNYGDSPTVERNPDRAIDDQSEKLAILNSAINTVSVRSDVFCVWFVLRGYAPTDVNELPNNDVTSVEPMIPSVERRFVMVVDRSNVTRKTDKPKVLLFKELPIE